MRNWISEAREVDQIISTQDKEQLKVLAAKIFGSNLYLENKTVRGDGQMSWSSLRSTPTGRDSVPTLGFEPRETFVACSTDKCN